MNNSFPSIDVISLALSGFVYRRYRHHHHNHYGIRNGGASSQPRENGKGKARISCKIGSGASVKEQDIMQLPYLDAVIKETMRLHPTAPLLLPHRAEVDVELHGFIILKHTRVFVNTWSITRDTAYWDEATIFRPERFLNSDIDFTGRDLSFIPFGAGRRICHGVPLGVRMVNSYWLLLFIILIGSFLMILNQKIWT